MMTLRERCLLLPLEVVLLVVALSWRFWFIALGAVLLVVATVLLCAEDGEA